MKRVFYLYIFIVGLFLFAGCKKKSTTTEPDTGHKWVLVDENFDYRVLNETLDPDSDLFLITDNYNIRISKDGVELDKTYHHDFNTYSRTLTLSPNYFVTYSVIDTDLVATFNPTKRTSYPAFLTFQDMTGWKLGIIYSNHWQIDFIPQPNDYFSPNSTDSGIVLIQNPDSAGNAIQLYFSKYSYQSSTGKIAWSKVVLLKNNTWYMRPTKYVYYKNSYYFMDHYDYNIYQLSSDNSSIKSALSVSGISRIENLFTSHDTLFTKTSYPDILQYTTDGKVWQTLPLGTESIVSSDMKKTLTGGYFTTGSYSANEGKIFDIYQNKYLTTNAKGLPLNGGISYLNIVGNYVYAVSNKKLYKLPLGYLFEN